MKKDIITNNMEIMEMLMKFSEEMNNRFEAVFEYMAKQFFEIRQELQYHRTRLDRIESNMATKGQLNSLLVILEDKKIINSFDVSHINQAGSV